MLYTSREKNSGSEVFTNLVLRETYTNPSGVNTVNVATTWTCGRKETVRDDNHPKFNRRIKSGEIIMGDQTRSLLQRDYTPMSLSGSVSPYQTNRTYASDWTGDLASQAEKILLPSITYPLANDLGKMADVALIKAYAKISGDQVMTGEILSDLGQTIRLLSRPFSGAAGYLNKMLKKKSKRTRSLAANAAQANASAWLEARYGLMPFVLDANTVIKNAISLKDRLERRRLVVRSSQSQDRTTSLSFPETICPLIGSWRMSGDVSVNHKVRAHAGVIYEVASATTSEQLSRDYCLGSDALLQTMWEVIPYSFVVDWFVGVGDWLQAMNLPANVRVLGNWVTTQDMRDCTYNVSSLKQLPGGPYTFTVYGSGGSSRTKSHSYVRDTNVPLPPYPVPDFQFKSVTHAVDATALALAPVLRALNNFRH